MEATIILDAERTFEVLEKAGIGALAVFVILESGSCEEPVTMDKLARLTGMSVAETEKACFKLGLVNLGITE
ncbi:hypothetical protein LLE49_24760 [Alicyclobacillus tolerans]|uniref:hypothetical protein n=1 Tax=Alicyclobacillus tolerans TaxID=90970 RepID=UPI001F42A8A1|nr:hypothetical protein [Alicyclobacillus tolerans]MCF8567939.1 hypothetical protein [Alicyclobacillus tolerans]